MSSKAPHSSKPRKPNVIQNIFFGGTAGVIGQSCVFPLYTIKTRLHLYPNRYNNVFHCARKIVQHDGLRGLYRGLPPALTGVFPEKAIKLGVNDYLSAVLARSDGTISLPMSVLSGAGAGFTQVIATNPMEMLMINMQSNAAAGRKPTSMLRMVKNLGLPGLYKGSAATLFRDVPFSMVFFSMNASLRTALTDDKGFLPMSRVFFAGIFSGSTAAALSTPMDVIKTRLQASAGQSPRPAGLKDVATSSTTVSSMSGVTARRMSTTSTPSPSYTNIAQCARHIYATQGIGGFFAGVVPRVLIISPLFGITLFFYDIQRRLQQSGRL